MELWKFDLQDEAILKGTLSRGTLIEEVVSRS